MKILALLLIAFALTGGELADSPLQQRVLALKNALIPVITVLGLQFGAGLGGAVVTETVFSISGLGKLMVDSINSRNYPMVQGGVLVIACVFTLVNLAVDVLYAYLDPRIKSQYGGRVKAKKLVKTETTEKGGGQG